MNKSDYNTGAVTGPGCPDSLKLLAQIDGRARSNNGRLVDCVERLREIVDGLVGGQPTKGSGAGGPPAPRRDGQANALDDTVEATGMIIVDLREQIGRLESL